jgi:UDP-N-acetylmuramoyl-L-alanyl-D-glutamate--2,6-diaminopimelate ligase
MGQWMKILLKDLIKPVGNVRLVGNGDVVITGIEYDSRRIEPGMLFAAVAGYKTDGRTFIGDAIKNGAAAILSDKPISDSIPVILTDSPRRALADLAASFYGFPAKDLFIVGVTGTNGKSTSVFVIKKILEISGKKTGMLNSLVYDTGREMFKAERTTPESLDVQKLLFEMKGAGCTHGVVEVSSHALVLNRVENIDFKIGLFTTFSRDHLDFHNTMEEYLAAKKLFLNRLEGINKVAVINKEVPEFAAFVEDARCLVITYSSGGEKADVMVRSPRLLKDRSVFELATPFGSRQVVIKLLGKYNLSNTAGAAAVGIALKIDLDIIVQGLENAEPVAGRFRPVNLGQPFTVLVDYAHTPDAIQRLCQSAREITTGRLMILFGCGGDRDRGKRPLMGQVASQFSDLAVVTSDNPRTEDPQKIIEDILPGMTGDNYLVIPDRREAIREIIGRARDNDTILIAGKGAEDYQEIGTVKYSFDDTVEVSRALTERGFEKANAR